MASEISETDLQTALSQLEAAGNEKKLSDGAVANIRVWLTEERYRSYAPQVAEHLAKGMWSELDDAFWTIIPFGTGGRRGRMYPIGSNAINERTIGESAQGLAEYVLEARDGDAKPSCAIAYDTRINSRVFAELCAGIMVAHGFQVYFLDDYRSTPALSFLVRYKQCDCGIMVTASHNPPSDNAVKVYWSTGGQVLPPHDKLIIKKVGQVGKLKIEPFDKAVEAGSVTICTEETDRAYHAAVLSQKTSGPRDLKIVYSPLHGVGTYSVRPILEGDGFTDLEVFGLHAEPDGKFPNVPGHVSNPENPAVFDAIITRAQEIGADLIMATDPDCDRMGCAAPTTSDRSGEWRTFTGNQIGALLTDFLLEKRQGGGQLSASNYVVKTLVTTEMIRRIADSYQVDTEGNLPVGFKWIGGKMDERGPDGFVFGSEESHGYLTGSYVRDKDGGVACMLMAELAAHVKAEGKTLHEKLEALYWQHGYHAENLMTIQMEGSEGMAEMEALMSRFRSSPPTSLGGINVAAVRDYNTLTRTPVGGEGESFDGPQGNMVILELSAEGNYVAARPSGTEPKIKLYMFTFTPAELIADMQLTRDEMDERLQGFKADLETFAKAK